MPKNYKQAMKLKYARQQFKEHRALRKILVCLLAFGKIGIRTVRLSCKAHHEPWVLVKLTKSKQWTIKEFHSSLIDQTPLQQVITI